MQLIQTTLQKMKRRQTGHAQQRLARLSPPGPRLERPRLERLRHHPHITVDDEDTRRRT